MKRVIQTLFALLFIILTVPGALATEKNKSETTLVDKFIAIFDFEVTTGDKGISRPLTDSTIHEFSKSDKYDVIDRGNMNKILKEQKFQISGCVAQECKVEAGQLLGVGKIVSGSVGLLGKTYFLTLQLINVQTGKVELSATDECKCEIDELIGSTRRLVKKLLGEQIEQPVKESKAQIEEQKRLADEQLGLEEQKKRLAEERARLEAEKQATATTYPHSGVWDGIIETYGGLFERAVTLPIQVNVVNDRFWGSINMYNENRTLTGSVDRAGNLINARLEGSFQKYELTGKIWEAHGEGRMGWKVKITLKRRP